MEMEKRGEGWRSEEWTGEENGDGDGEVRRAEARRIGMGMGKEVCEVCIGITASGQCRPFGEETTFLVLGGKTNRGPLYQDCRVRFLGFGEDILARDRLLPQHVITVNDCLTECPSEYHYWYSYAAYWVSGSSHSGLNFNLPVWYK